MPLGWTWMPFLGSQKDRIEASQSAGEATWTSQEGQGAYTRRRGSRHDGKALRDDHRSRRQRHDNAGDNVTVPVDQHKRGAGSCGQERVDTRRSVSESDDQQTGLPSNRSSLTVSPPTVQEGLGQGDDAFRTWQSQKAEMESIIKQRCQEAYELERELKSATRRIAEWEENYDILQERLNSANIQAEERMAEVSRELRRVEKENQELRRVEKENQELRLVEKENERLHDEGVKVQRQLEQLTIQSERMEENFQKSQKLLKSCTEELRLAQTFLTTADEHSIADICHMVDQLNEEIYQCTMMMSDALIEQRGMETQKGEDDGANRLEVCHRVQQRWCPALVSRLQADVKEDETTLFESLLQHVLMCRCYEIVQSFSLDSREFDNRFLALWDSILQAYETPIAKRWLAITHSQLKSPVVDHSSIMRDLSFLMFAGGWSNEIEGSQALPEKVMEKVRELSERALKIREAIAEGILSAEVDVFYYEDGTLFDPAKMQDAWDIGARSGVAGYNSEDIVCSTGLGVRYITRERRSSAGESDQEKKETVLKPKVLLPSALEPAG